MKKEKKCFNHHLVRSHVSRHILHCTKRLPFPARKKRVQCQPKDEIYTKEAFDLRAICTSWGAVIAAATPPWKVAASILLVIKCSFAEVTLKYETRQDNEEISIFFLFFFDKFQYFLQVTYIMYYVLVIST